jgi:hypothetical protein
LAIVIRKVEENCNDLKLRVACQVWFMLMRPIIAENVNNTRKERRMVLDAREEGGPKTPFHPHG